MSLRPRRQVQIRKKITAATISGTNPPSKTFIRLAATNDKSTTMNSPATIRLAGRLQFQISRITRNISTEVSSIVSDTAMPNAAARLSDERNVMRKPERQRHQHPIDEADIDLPVALRRGLRDVQARTKPELDRLPRHRKCAADDRLARDNGRERSQAPPAAPEVVTGTARRTDWRRRAPRPRRPLRPARRSSAAAWAERCHTSRRGSVAAPK